MPKPTFEEMLKSRVPAQKTRKFIEDFHGPKMKPARLEEDGYRELGAQLLALQHELEAREEEFEWVWTEEPDPELKGRFYEYGVKIRAGLEQTRKIREHLRILVKILRESDEMNDRISKHILADPDEPA